MLRLFRFGPRFRIAIFAFAGQPHPPPPALVAAWIAGLSRTDCWSRRESPDITRRQPCPRLRRLGSSRPRRGFPFPLVPGGAPRHRAILHRHLLAFAFFMADPYSPDQVGVVGHPGLGALAYAKRRRRSSSSASHAARPYVSGSLGPRCSVSVFAKISISHQLSSRPVV